MAKPGKPNVYVAFCLGPDGTPTCPTYASYEGVFAARLSSHYYHLRAVRNDSDLNTLWTELIQDCNDTDSVDKNLNLKLWYTWLDDHAPVALFGQDPPPEYHCCASTAPDATQEPTWTVESKGDFFGEANDNFKRELRLLQSFPWKRVYPQLFLASRQRRQHKFKVKGLNTKERWQPFDIKETRKELQMPLNRETHEIQYTSMELQAPLESDQPNVVDLTYEPERTPQPAGNSEPLPKRRKSNPLETVEDAQHQQNERVSVWAPTITQESLSALQTGESLDDRTIKMLLELAARAAQQPTRFVDFLQPNNHGIAPMDSNDCIFARLHFKDSNHQILAVVEPDGSIDIYDDWPEVTDEDCALDLVRQLCTTIGREIRGEPNFASPLRRTKKSNDSGVKVVVPALYRAAGIDIPTRANRSPWGPCLAMVLGPFYQPPMFNRPPMPDQSLEVTVLNGLQTLASDARCSLEEAQSTEMAIQVFDRLGGNNPSQKSAAARFLRTSEYLRNAIIILERDVKRYEGALACLGGTSAGTSED